MDKLIAKDVIRITTGSSVNLKKYPLTLWELGQIKKMRQHWPQEFIQGAVRGFLVRSLQEYNHRTR